MKKQPGVWMEAQVWENSEVFVAEWRMRSQFSRKSTFACSSGFRVGECIVEQGHSPVIVPFCLCSLAKQDILAVPF
jgi:hypothetical protein